MKYRHGTAPVAAAGWQISSETSGAPAGPGTSRSVTSNAPSRRMSSSVGTGNGDGACRIAGSSSRESIMPPRELISSMAGCSSGSNGGGGPTGTACDASVVEIPDNAASFTALRRTSPPDGGAALCGQQMRGERKR